MDFLPAKFLKIFVENLKCYALNFEFQVKAKVFPWGIWNFSNKPSKIDFSRI